MHCTRRRCRTRPSTRSRPQSACQLGYRTYIRRRQAKTLAPGCRRGRRCPEYRRLRHFVVRRVEGYDAADPARGQVIPITPNFERGGASVVAELSHSRKVATEIYLCQTKPTKIAGVNERPNPWPQSDHQNHRSTSSLIAPLPARSLVSPARSPRDRLANTVNGYGTRSSLNLISMKRPVLSC